MAEFDNERDRVLFSHLMDYDYEVWAKKMEHWITNNDMTSWKVIQNGNTPKRCGRDSNGKLFRLPPSTADEALAVHRESKASITLLQSIPAYHLASFRYMDDARDIWKAIKARYAGQAESKMMRKEACTTRDAEAFTLMGIPSQDLKVATDEVIYTKKLNATLETDKQELQDKFDKEFAGRMQWQEGAHNLEKLINSSQSTRSRRALGYSKYLGPDEVAEPNKPSVFDAEPLLEFQTPVNYVKEGGMNAVSPPIRGVFMPSSPQKDFDESQMTYGKKSNDLPDLSCKTNDFVFCSTSDKSSDLKSTDYTSCDSSDKSDTPKVVEPKTKKVTYSVKPNFVSSDVSDKSLCNKQSCVKNKSFKKKTCFVCGSKSHLIKDCDFHEKRMGVCADQKRPRPTWTNVASIPPFVPKATQAKSSRPRPRPIPTGKSVPTDRLDSADRPFPAGWKRHVARPYYRPTSIYFQNGFWACYYDPMYMGWGARWNSSVKPSTGYSWKTQKKGSFWVPKNSFYQVH